MSRSIEVLYRIVSSRFLKLAQSVLSHFHNGTKGDCLCECLVAVVKFPDFILMPFSIIYW